MIQNLSKILKQQKNSIQNGYLSLTTVGKSVIFEDHHVDYYEKPLKKLVLPAQVPIGDLLINTLQNILNSNGTNVLSGESSGGGSGGSSGSDSGSGLLGALSDSGSSSGGSGSGSSDLMSALEDAGESSGGSGGNSDSSSSDSGSSGSGSGSGSGGSGTTDSGSSNSGSSDSGSSDSSDGFLEALNEAKQGYNGDNNSKRDLSGILNKNEKPEDMLNDLIERLNNGDDDREALFAEGLQRLAKFL